MNADYEIIVFNPETGFTRDDPGYTIRILGYNNSDRQGTPAEDFYLENGDDQRLNGFSLYYSLKIMHNAGGSEGYTVVLAEGDGSDGNAILPVDWLSFQARKTLKG